MAVMNPAPVPAPLEAVAAGAAAEPGYMTTEFWVTVASEVVGLLTACGVIHPSTEVVNGIMALLGTTVPTALYALSRGLRKQGTPG